MLRLAKPRARRTIPYMLSALLASCAFAPRAFDFYGLGPYDSAVPKPETILGYGPGERLTTFRDQERVIEAIAGGAKNRVRVIEYGKSVEGRPLKIVVIGAPNLISRLDTIRAQHAELAAGKGDPKKTVPIVWINECIHGNETASFESGMWTLYTLAASKSPAIQRALEHELVILNPVYNPDGHERHVVYNSSLAVGSPSQDAFEQSQPGTVFGRTNHYRFDLNRDRISFSQDETRQEFAEFLRWNPQVNIDQHGEVGSYFFPPEAMAINANVDRARNAKWTELLGKATAQAFDKAGFSYFIRDTFDLFYPGYVDSSVTLSGSIGMTQETDGGTVLARERPDGSVVTLKRGVEKHFTSALTVVETAGDHADELIEDYAKFKRSAVDGSAAGKFRFVVVSSPDPRPLKRLQTQLAYGGIQSRIGNWPLSAPDAHDYWTGKTGDQTAGSNWLLVDMAQPQGAYAKALLEATSEFEPEFIKAQVAKRKNAPEGEKYPGPESGEFYDTTAWSLPYAYDLPAFWTSLPPREARGHAFFPDHRLALASSNIGYALRYKDDQDILAVFDVLGKGVRGMATTKTMHLGAEVFDAGTFLFLADRNQDGYEEVLKAVGSARGVEFVPLATGYPEGREGPGSESTIILKKPKIAFVMGSGTNLYASGSIWYLLDRVFHLPYTPISSEALGRVDLGKYTCIILPQGAVAPTSGKFKDWLSAGNVAISLGGINWAVGSSNYVELPEVKGEPQSLPGSLFRAQVDSRSFLSYGYPLGVNGKAEIAVPVQGENFYQTRKEGGSVVSLSGDDSVTKLLSGWAWPEDTEKNLKGTVWAQDVPVGAGHLILFTQDPTERAMWPGLYRMLLNGMLIGSGQ